VCHPIDRRDTMTKLCGPRKQRN